jgi:flagellar hook-basal body complex protein FliE
MPNILKRPMFRKGGSAAEGTGITTGLRQGYDLGGPVEELIQKRYEQLKPTPETTVSDFMTALGATAPQDPTKLQTFGQVLSQAGTTASGLRKQREEAAESFKTGAVSEVVKNLTAPEKDQLIRRAKEYARLNNIPEDEAINMFLSKLLEGPQAGSEYLKDYSPAVRARQIGESLAEEGFTSPGAFQEQITAGNIWQLWESNQLTEQVQKTLSATTYPRDLVIDPENGTATFNPDKKGINESRYVPNKSYVNPKDGGIYLYEGDGQFKKIYP